MNEYAKFVKGYSKKHPSLKGPKLFKSAAKAYHPRARRRNPEITLQEDEVLAIVPTSLSGSADIEIPPGVVAIPLDRELVEQHAGEGIASNPIKRLRRHRRNPSCPNCGNPVQIPRGMKEGKCPHCSRLLKVRSA